MFDTIKEVINSSDMPNPSGRYNTFESVAFAVVNFIIAVGFAFGLVSIAFSAIFYILSGGNPDKTKTAWNAFLYGVIASMVSLAIVFLKNAVMKVFGVVPGDTVL